MRLSSKALPELQPGIVDLRALVQQAGGGRDRYSSGVCHADRVEVYDHDPRDPARGHVSCSPKCWPIDVLVGVTRWEDLAGNPITDPDHIAFLESRRKGQAG